MHAEILINEPVVKLQIPSRQLRIDICERELLTNLAAGQGKGHGTERSTGRSTNHGTNHTTDQGLRNQRSSVMPMVS